MILAEPTEHGTGIFLYGEDPDLSNLHKTIHELTSERFFASQLLDFTIALAYNIRKAYEGQREKREMGFDQFDNKVVYLGVKMFWPAFLVQLGMLRWSAGFQATTKKQQKQQAHLYTLLYTLESLAEGALLEYDANIGQKAIDWLDRFNGFHKGYLVQFFTEVQREYASLPDGRSRFKELPNRLC